MLQRHTLLAACVCLLADTAHATRETLVATDFHLFVPANNDNNGRYSAVVITAAQGSAQQPTVVQLIDDASDGDSDDTLTNVALVAGQSIVRYIRDGATNDDAGGKWDGDRFFVCASLPVSALLVTDSDWQHDWAPADNGTQRGEHFYLYANRTSLTPRDVNAFAYEDDTRVSLYDITQTPLTTSGVTTIVARTNPVLSVDLQAGEDLRTVHGLGLDILAAGRTYELVATKPVTVMFGALGALNPATGGTRDGGGYVPGASGTPLDDEFYFTIPHDPGLVSEQELRIVSADDGVAVALAHFDAATGTFVNIANYTLNALDHADRTGGPDGLFRLTASGGAVAVFEANWLETGSPGTSDDASYVPGFIRNDGSTRYVLYAGPPGRQANTTGGDTRTHIYLASQDGASNVTIVDADTGGSLFSQTVSLSADGFADVWFNTRQYDAMNRTAQGLRPYLRIESPSPLSVMMSNWNDNWMAYASSTRIRNPEIVMTQTGSGSASDPRVVSADVVNVAGSTLDNVTVNVTVAPQFTVQSATLDSVGPSATSTGAAGTQLTFAPTTLTGGTTSTLEVVMTSTSGISGSVAPIVVTVNATENGDPIASTTSAPVTVTRSGVATLDHIDVVASGGRVEVAINATDANAIASSLRLERSGAANGTFTELTALRQTTTGTDTNTRYTFVDTTVANGSTYYYRVHAFGEGGAEALAGPVVAQPSDREPPPVPTLGAAAHDRSVTLGLSGSAVSDLRGYVIDRTFNGTTFTRITATPIAGPSLVDGSRTNGVPVGYRAASVDTTGNVSGFSPIVWATPLGTSVRDADQLVLFEDMIGAGENDWDYNDFVVRIISTEEFNGSGQLTRLVLDYEPLARGAGYIHRFEQRIATAGDFTARIMHFDSASGAVVSDTTENHAAGSAVVIWDDTRDAFVSDVDGYTNTLTAQRDAIAAETVTVIFTLSSPAANADGSFGQAPFIPTLVVPYLPTPNSITLPQVGGPLERTNRDGLAGVDLPFAMLVPTVDQAWPLEGEPVWRAYPMFEAHILTGAAHTTGWHDDPPDEQRIFRRGRKNGVNP